MGFRKGNSFPKSKLLSGFSSKLFLLLLTTVVCVIFAELALRYIVKIPLPSFKFQLKYPQLFEEYDAFGYRLHPSREMHYRYPPDSPVEIKITSNADGFRSSRELEQRDERKRIMIIGDSFVFGDGVEEQDRFSNILETLEPNWRIDNLGMTGFGPDLMLRAFESVGLALTPQIAVFCMYTDDFRRVRPYYAGVGFKIPRYKLESGKLITIPYPEKSLLHESAIYHSIRHIYWTKSDAIYRLNEAILDRFLSLAHAHQIQPVIIFLPGRGDKSWDKERRFWLKNYSQQHSVPFNDFTDLVHSYKRKDVFIYNNPHLNSRGHQIVAEALYQFLDQQLLNDFHEHANND